MSKYLGLREEHMDLYGTLADGVYTSGKAFTSGDSYGTAIPGNIIQRTADDVALWRAKLLITTDFASSGSATATVKIKAGHAVSGGSITNAVEVYSSSAIALSSLKAGNWLLDMVLPSGYEFYQVTITPGTAAFTAGTVKGWVEPEFN